MITKFIKLTGRKGKFIIIRLQIDENEDMVTAIENTYQYYAKNGFRREDVEFLSEEDGRREELKSLMADGVLITGQESKGKYKFSYSSN